MDAIGDPPPLLPVRPSEAPPKVPSASPWSWTGLREKAWQALSLSAVLSVIAGIAYGAGYFAIVRKALTLGIPNPETGTSAYQHMGLSMLLDTLSVVWTGVTSPRGAALVTLVVIALSAAVCLGAKPSALKLKLWSLVSGYAVLLILVVRDGLQIWGAFEASNLLQSTPEALRGLHDLAGQVFEAVRSGDATALRHDYAGFAAAVLATISGAIVLGILARGSGVSPRWPGPIITAQLVLATCLFGETILLAQLYGVVSLANSQRCVLVSYTQAPDLARERSQLGWLMSDLAFGGDHVSVVKPDADSWLYVIKRADVVSYRFFSRANCMDSILPNAPAAEAGRTQ